MSGAIGRACLWHRLRRAAGLVLPAVIVVAGLSAVQVVTAPASQAAVGVDWRVDYDAQGFIGRDVAFGNDIFVAVSAETSRPWHKVARSTDGQHWEYNTDYYSPNASLDFSSHVAWKSVTYGGGVFVAVSLTGQIMTTTDGLNWTPRTPSSTETLVDVAYGAGTFVALASNGTVLTSSNGTTWTTCSGGTTTVACTNPAHYTGNFNAVAFGNGTFVAVANLETMTSPDGVTWTGSGDIANSTGNWTFAGLAYGTDGSTPANPRWVALPVMGSGAGTNSLYSADGLTWTRVSPGTNLPGRCFGAVTYAASMFVALSCDGSHTPAIITSGNGTGWSNVLSQYPGVASGSGIAYGNGMFVGTFYNAWLTSQAAPAITVISPVNGPTTGGRTVTITGTTLQNTTGVTFNGVAATSITNVSSTELTAVAPTGTAGAATVEVTTWGGSTTSTAFTYVTPPAITSVTPANGPTTGGRTITVTGTNLGSTTSVTVDGVAATGIVNTSGTQISFVTPAGSAGVKDVVLTTAGGGPVTASAAFTYVTPPAVTSLSPVLGLSTGGTSVTLTGTDLANTTGVTVGGAAATNLVNVDGTHITFDTPSGTIGQRDVVVTTSGGGPSATATNAFRYIGQPTITSVTPSGGPTTGGTSVTIAGTNLTNATNVTIGGVAATKTANTDTSLTVTAPTGTAGSASVVVQTYDGAASVTSTNAYTYAAPPTIVSVSPNVKLAAGGGTVTITGANLSSTTGVMVGGVAATNVANVDATHVTFTAPAGTAGLADVVLTTTYGGSVTVTNGFRYIDAPTITSMTPTVGPIGGGTTVVVTGTNLINTTSVSVGGVAATSIVNTGSTSIAFTTALSGTSGLRDVVLQTYDGVGSVTSANAFRYVPVPTITSVTPAAGPTTSTTSVVIAGTNLDNTTSLTVGGSAATVTANTSASVTATFPTGSAGAKDVVLQTYGGAGTVTSAGAFTYVTPPAVASVSPAYALSTGGTAVTLTGTNLASTTTVTVGGVAATNVVNVSATEVTFTAPATTVGSRDIVVTTTAGGASTVTGASVIESVSAPTISGVSPVVGPVAGGTSVTITGTNLLHASAVTVGTTAATITGQTATTVTFTTPAKAAGVADVTVQTYGGVGTVTSSNAFTYVAAPTITSLTPAVARANGGQPVTLTGTNLANTTSVTVGGVTATGLTNLSATQVSFVVPANPAGLADVVLTTAGGGSVTSSNGFRYILAPTATSITPAAGSLAGGTSVTVVGTNLTNVTSVTVGTNAATVTANDATSVTFTTPAGTAGAKTITIMTYGTAAFVAVSNGFEYVVAPTLTAMTPQAGAAGTAITLTGTDLGLTTSVTVGGAAATFSIVNATEVTVVAPGGLFGARAVALTTPGGTVLAPALFTYPDPPAPAPSPSSPAASTPTAPVATPVSLAAVPPSVPLLPGQDTVLVGGVLVPVVIAADSANTGLVLTGDGWAAQIGAVTAAGRPEPLGSGGSIALPSGGTVSLSASGYAPNSDIAVYLMSDPQLLGVLATGADGAVVGALPLPATLPSGNHTLQVNGVGSDGLLRSISLGVTVMSPQTRVRSAGSRVVFAYRDATLTKAAKHSLRALLRQVGGGAHTTITTRVAGAVRATGANAADRRLARERVDVVAAFLRRHGLDGPIVVRTQRIPVTNGAVDRRVDVTVRWRG